MTLGAEGTDHLGGPQAQRLEGPTVVLPRRLTVADEPAVSDLGDLHGKRVLVRSDLNVPLDGETITDDGRIRASVPTIRQLTEKGARATAQLLTEAVG